MSAARIELYPRTPWALRLFDRTALPPLWVGFGIGVSLFGVFLLYTAIAAAVGHPFKLATPGWMAEALEDLFLGFTLAVAAASVRGAVRDLDALGPALDAAASDPARLRREALTYRPAPLWLAGIAMGLFSAITTPLDPTLWADGRFPGFANPTAAWLAGRNFLNWFAVGFAMGLELMLGQRFSRLGDHLASIDLLDRARLAPFGRRALRNVSFWMLLAAFLGLHYSGIGLAGKLLPLGLVTLTAFALAAFLLPLWGAHRRLQACKAAELSRVRAALYETRERVLAPSTGESTSGGRLADLVAYEQRIAGAGEWPIDTSTWLRFAFYLMVGLGSWVGAALVEWVVDLALR